MKDEKYKTNIQAAAIKCALERLISIMQQKEVENYLGYALNAESIEIVKRLTMIDSIISIIDNSLVIGNTKRASRYLIALNMNVIKLMTRITEEVINLNHIT